MRYWIYKCNSRGHSYQAQHGDWERFFLDPKDGRWGSTEWVPDFEKLKRDDTVLAYQTDRNELVGLCTVERLARRGQYKDLILRPVYPPLNVKVRPLKQQDRKIRSIPALQPGPIKTLYALSSREGSLLIRAAKEERAIPVAEAAEEAEDWAQGGGFGSAEDNRKVEAAAMAHVKALYRKEGWTVTDVSSARCGYDLRCTRGRSTRHVEVKGSRGSQAKFMLTNNECETWRGDPNYSLELVTDALREPRVSPFRGPRALKKVSLKVIAYVCTVG